ncbi:leukocidin family pore-forming toxin [Pseudoalteromonas sp. BZB3]|uniref:leukocidin family pore-forming toxin n=1 Tax=Pseudoalteromonas sp. BZB3 TaxID=3136670 RepID=UPI0032C44B1E
MKKLNLIMMGLLSVGMHYAPHSKANTDTVISIGGSETPLSANLMVGVKNDMHFSAEGFETHSNIEKHVASASIIHANLADFYGEAKKLNGYIAEAMKQNKLIILENTQFAKNVFLDEMPFTADAEVMIYKPDYNQNGGMIHLFGSTVSHVRAEKQRIASGGDNRGFQDIYDGQVNTLEESSIASHGFSFPEAFDRELKNSLVKMEGAKLEEALSSIKQSISLLESGKPFKSGNHELFGQQTNNSFISTSSTPSGGALGYSCPKAAKDERLCWASIVVNRPYQHSNGQADINILNHYSFGAFRTDQYTAIAVSPNGSVNPNMKVNSEYEKAYFLKNHSVKININDADGLQLYRRMPQNAVNSSSVASTSGFDFSISGGVDKDGPSLGASIGYSESKTITENLIDWETSTTSNGSNAVWNMSLNKYKSINDWVYQDIFRWARLRGTPSISKNGLQYTTEAIWLGDKYRDGQFRVTMNTTTENSKLWFTDNSIWGWSAKQTGWIHSLYVGSQSFNNAWLKKL